MNEKRIALVGNMNNAFFPMARYLSLEGHKVTLFILPQEPKHFLPVADTFDENHGIQIEKLLWHYGSLWSTSKNEIRNRFKDFDFIFAEGISPAYLNKAGIRIDVFVPYGGDMYRIPHYSKIRTRGIKNNIKRFFLARNQKLGIRKSKIIEMPETNDFFEEYLNQLAPKGKRIKTAIPYLFLDQYEDYEENFGEKSKYIKTFKHIRNQFDFVVFSHGRQMWKDIPDSSYCKGNDKLILAFSEFLLETSSTAVLILFEYGNDVENSKKLISKLDIKKNVIWMPLMERKEIMMGMLFTDLGVGELTHSYFTYGAIMEFMAMGIPFLHYRNDALYTDIYPEMYPMINATSTKSIKVALNKVYSDRAYGHELGEGAKKWLKKFSEQIPLQTYINLINE